MDDKSFIQKVDKIRKSIKKENIEITFDSIVLTDSEDDSPLWRISISPKDSKRNLKITPGFK